MELEEVLALKEGTRIKLLHSDDPLFTGDRAKDLGVQKVKVSDIIGGNPHASKNYDPDWNPYEVEFDTRYQRVERIVKEAMVTQRDADALDLGYIHLFKFYNKELGKEVYYVCVDGHRRTSVAHRLNVPYILAKVTEVY